MIHVVLLSFILFWSSQNTLAQQELILNGRTLTLNDVVEAAENKREIKVCSEALEKVKRSYEILLQAGNEDKPIYGLNRGVGLNKDKTIYNVDVDINANKKLSEDFNKNILFSHSVAFEPEVPAHIVFGLMIVRLNMMLNGHSGVSPEVVVLLAHCINHRIQPVILSRGSLGESDIPALAHLGLVLMGEGMVIYNDKRMKASAAFDECGLQPIIPYAKDALAIMSSNAYSVALSIMVLDKANCLLDNAELIFALSLESLNGNIAPFLPIVQCLRPYEGQIQTAKNICNNLDGSYLWQSSSTRNLQDPLSFRCVSQVHGAARDIIKSLKEKISIHINSSDDNPAVIGNLTQDEEMSPQEKSYFLKNMHDAVVPTANFDSIAWVIEFEALAIALCHISHLSVQRMLRLSDEKHTGLLRFLAPNENVMGFDALQYSFVALDTEIRSLVSAHSMDFFPVSGSIEDHATLAPVALHRLIKIIDNLYFLFGIELMHAAQAADLRQKYFECTLANPTERLRSAFREEVSFLDKDRPLFNDIQKSKDFVQKMDCLFMQK